MKYILFSTLIIIGLVSLTSCKKDSIKANYKSKVQGNSDAAVASLQNINNLADKLGVVELPAIVDSKIRSTFKWYTQYTAPNGKRIHMLAQSGWTKEQVAYTRTVLAHYLTNDLSVFYGNKDAVANNIAKSNGAMTMFDSESTKSNNESGINGQDLQATETVAIGTPEYLDASVRNAALEEILHFVHDLGISPAFPSFQKELEQATANAIDNRIFIPWNKLPVADYDNENLAGFNDAYWGLLEHKTSLDNPYLFLSREAAAVGDPLNTNLMQKFLPKYFTSSVFIASTFSGTFFMTKNSNLVYTNQSQYYKDARLVGQLNSNLSGNDWPNKLEGNSGNNELTGGKGDDVLDGGEGTGDIAIFSGVRSEYIISTIGFKTTIEDNIIERDGVDVLLGIEKAKFSDQTVNL